MPQNAPLFQHFERSRCYCNVVSPRIDRPIREAAAGLPEDAV